MDHLLEVDARRLLLALAEEGSIDGPLRLRGPAPRDGEVLLVDAPQLHLHGKVPRGRVILRHEGEPAGLAIEAIDDGDLAAASELEGKESAQLMPERAGVGGLARVDGE